MPYIKIKRKVSVIMGIYNCAPTLKDALDSLVAQKYKDWELIMCDDASSDDTLLIAMEYAEKYNNILLIQNSQNSGLPFTLNRCIEYADSEYIARMDGDDLSTPDRFEKEVRFLDEHPEYALVSCAMTCFDEHGDWGIQVKPEHPTKMTFVNDSPFNHAACIMRRKELAEVGNYTVREDLRRGQDYYLWHKFYSLGYKGYNIQESLYKMRDDANAARRRTIKARLKGIKVQFEIFNNLNIPFVYYYIILARPLVAILLPHFIKQIIHRRRVGLPPIEYREKVCNHSLVSIVIPVYNQEHYLEKCLDSVLNQTYRNLEIICVNDGSTDNSLHILKEYADKDSRVVLIDKPNEGVSKARKVGVEVSKGDYIKFLDSDDWLDENAVTYSVNIAEGQKADIVLYDYVREYDGKSLPKYIADRSIHYCMHDNKRLLYRLIGPLGDDMNCPDRMDIYNSMCCKLFKRSVLACAEYVDVKDVGSSEDLLFNLSVFCHADSVFYFNYLGYHYRRVNANSNTKSFRPNLSKQWILLFDKIANYVEDEEAKKALDNRIAISLLSLGLNEVENNDGFICQYKRIKELLFTEPYRDAIRKLDVSQIRTLQWKLYFCCIKHGYVFILVVLLRIMKFLINSRNG